MTLLIPKTPNNISFVVDHLWTGDPGPDERVQAQVWIAQSKVGIEIKAESPILHEQLIPDAPIGTRVDKLWNFDVVEVFLVGPGHQYLEIELGAGGHFLVLGFDSIRKQSNNYEKFAPVVRYKKTTNKTWMSEITIPWNMVPDNLRAMNVFMIAAGQFLSHSPLPGAKPDFHQPDRYPVAKLG